MGWILSLDVINAIITLQNQSSSNRKFREESQGRRWVVASIGCQHRRKA